MIELVLQNGSKLEIRVHNPDAGLDVLIEWRTKHYRKPREIEFVDADGKAIKALIAHEVRCATSLGEVGVAHCSHSDEFSAHKGRTKSLEKALLHKDLEGVVTPLLGRAQRADLWQEILKALPPPRNIHRVKPEAKPQE